MPADANAVVVNETATEITGHRQEPNTQERQNQGRQGNFGSSECRSPEAQIDSIDRDDNKIQNQMGSGGAFAWMIAADGGVIDEAGHGSD